MSRHTEDYLKYRQRGYQDDRKEEPKQKSSQGPSAPKRDNTFGPRPLQMAATRAVSRCSQCGTLLQGIDPNGKCPKCGFELHACKQCTQFDPSSRFECAEKVPERISPKDKKNNCAFYSMRVMLEKETSSSTSGSASPAKPGGSNRVQDARQAFENLFKK
ncbi:MAG TPA: hypothetical protein VGF44_14635 [Terriglobales bacterium]